MTSLLQLTPEEIEAVRTILRHCLPDRVAVRAFGGRATGKAKPWSDLDLSFEAKEALLLSVMALLREAFDESALPWKVDLVDYRTVSAEFAAIIDRDGLAVL